MELKKYNTLSISIENFNNKKGISRTIEIREPYLTTFIINQNIYHVLATNHSHKRLKQRGVNKYHVASSILSLGEKIESYNNSGKHIIINDEVLGISTVISVEKFNVVIVTVLDNGKMNISDKVDKMTVVETIPNMIREGSAK